MCFFLLFYPLHAGKKGRGLLWLRGLEDLGALGRSFFSRGQHGVEGVSRSGSDCADRVGCLRGATVTAESGGLGDSWRGSHGHWTVD